MLVKIVFTYLQRTCIKKYVQIIDFSILNWLKEYSIFCAFVEKFVKLNQVDTLTSQNFSKKKNFFLQNFHVKTKYFSFVITKKSFWMYQKAVVHSQFFPSKLKTYKNHLELNTHFLWENAILDRTFVFLATSKIYVKSTIVQEFIHHYSQCGKVL